MLRAERARAKEDRARAAGAEGRRARAEEGSRGEIEAGKAGAAAAAPAPTPAAAQAGTPAAAPASAPAATPAVAVPQSLWEGLAPRGGSREARGRLTKLASPAPAVFYCRKFLSDAEEQWIISVLDASPWTQLNGRRVQCFGREPAASAAAFSRKPLPQWVSQLCEGVAGFVSDPGGLDHWVPDHVLVNEYAAGEGIMAHTDGPFYRAVTVTLSLGSDALVHFAPRVAPEDVGLAEAPAGFDVVLHRGSLLLFTDEVYTRWTHEIRRCPVEVAGALCPVLAPEGAAGEGAAEEGEGEGEEKGGGTALGAIIERRRRLSVTLRRVDADGPEDA